MKLDAERQALAESCLRLAWKIAGRHVARMRRAGFAVDPDDAFGRAGLALCRAAAGYDPEKLNPETGRPYAFGTYAGRVVALELLGRRGRRRWPPDPCPLPPAELADPGPGPAEAAARAEARSALAALMSSLSDAQAEAVRLCRLGGLNCREAAPLLGVSHQAVADRIQSALARMRQEARRLGISFSDL